MADPTTPAALLDKAADVITANGWTVEEYYRVPLGDDRLPISHDPKKCRVCPRGAIAVAAGQHPAFAVDYDRDDPHSDEEQAAYAEIRVAERLLVDHLIDGMGWKTTVPDRRSEVIEYWADAPDRTLPQILGAMRAAAERGRTDG